MSLSGFHPAVAAWFDARFEAPTEPQRAAWPAIQRGEHTLIAAPTGSGKTLAAFLAAIDDLVRRAEAGTLTDETHVLYVSPLKALSNDIHHNLQLPLAEIGAELAIRGFPDSTPIRTLVRTGDTPAKERAAMVRNPPHIVVTTPESLAILLTSERGRKLLGTVRTVIVDEIHAVAPSKRGSHLALSLERLEALVPDPLTRIGLSATQKPIETVARFLVGARDGEPGTPACTIVDSGHVRRLDLAVEVPDSPLEAVMSHEVWDEVFDRLTALISEHRTTLVFVNTRRLAERVARCLSDRLGDDAVTSHHGSLSREQRLEAERRLKAGELRALVATASLELGIDVGDVDLVCQLGSTRSIATFLQRVGRAGHTVRATPKGRLFPLSRDELVECAALFDAVRRGELDRLIVPEAPLDILAQHIVAALASEEWGEDDLYALVRRAAPYRALPRERFDAVVRMLADGFTTRRGRRGAYVHRDAVHGKLRGRRGARLAAITSGGAIPDNADYRVLQEPIEALVGTVNEDFAIESTVGDVFQLGNASWRILKVETGTVRVADAGGDPPTLPFWLGEAPSRSDELSAAVSRVRETVDGLLETGAAGGNGTPHAAQTWLTDDVGLCTAAAEQIVEYLGATRQSLGTVPTQKTLVLERFFDEAGGMQLVLHAPFGSRLNRAWGLALRKRFCRQFNFELQAAATEDAIVLSLGPTHSFPLDDVYGYLHPDSVREVLVQALLDAPMFQVRWRWNAGRALAVLRFAGGRKVPPQLQRMQAEDLIAVVFPDQLACLENVAGEREIPDHPLVQETIRDCLTEAMDIDRLEGLLREVRSGSLNLLARDLTEPSPLSHEILNAKPYAFLDDAPLEERRTQAVLNRRWLDADTANDLGALDAAAMDRVREEAWPDPRDADELHDTLLILGALPAEEGHRGAPADRPEPDGNWTAWFETLVADGRAAVVRPQGARGGLWVAAERLPMVQAVHPDATVEPPTTAPEPETWTADAALVELARGRLECVGPVTPEALGATLYLDSTGLHAPLAALEGEGFALRGRFTPGAGDTEWCERRLLARIHRYTLNRLRREIEPVPAAVFLRFLFRWQGLTGDDRPQGPDALAAVLDRLEGFEAAAAAWESDILPARLPDYDPAWLDALCLSGRAGWARLRRSTSGQRVGGPIKATPIALGSRRGLPMWLGLARHGETDAPEPTGQAAAVAEALREHGASFFEELLHGTNILSTQLEAALAELVAAGEVSADGFTGLRALLTPQDRRPRPGYRGGRRTSPAVGVADAGRWAAVRAPEVDPHDPEVVETVAWTLLRRYGVVFRRLLEREGALPPWRLLLRAFYRLEARGDIRGGRFVGGFSGQQFALPEAVGSLRELRNRAEEGEWITISAADPLNLVGILSPEPRVAALAGNRVLFRDGVPLASRQGGETRHFAELDEATAWKVGRALDRRPVPPRLRSYLGSR